MCAGLAMIASGAGFVITWLGSFILGMGVGISSIAGNICILATAAGHAASRLNRLHLFFGIGALIGPFIAWAGQQTPWSYHATYLFGVLYTAVVGAILIKAPDVAISVNSKAKADGTSSSESSDKQSEIQPGRRHVLKEPLLWLHATILCIYVGIETGAGTWLFTFVEKEFQLSAGASAVAMSFLWGGLTLGRMSGIPLTRRFRPESITLVAMLISSAALVTLICSSNLSDMALLVVALLGFGFGPVFPTIIGGATTRFPQATGTVTTTLVTLGFIGGIIGPWTIGAVFEKIGLEQGMELLLATSILMTVLYGICAVKSRNR
jgi:fucose permease